MGTVRTKGSQQWLCRECYGSVENVDRENPLIEPVRGTCTNCGKENVGIIPWLPPSK